MVLPVRPDYDPAEGHLHAQAAAVRFRRRERRGHAHVRVMSALPPKAEMDQHGSDVPTGRDVGQADDCFISLHRPLG